MSRSVARSRSAAAAAGIGAGENMIKIVLSLLYVLSSIVNVLLLLFCGNNYQNYNKILYACSASLIGGKIKSSIDDFANWRALGFCQVFATRLEHYTVSCRGAFLV